MSKPFKRILLTGAAGGLGKVLRPKLSTWAEKQRVSDLKPLSEATATEELVSCDVGDFAAMHALLDGVDAVVHLGGISLDGPFEPMIHANIRGVYNLYEAARTHGLKRVVLASSSHVVGFHKQTDVLDANVPLRPDCNYGVSKACGEAISRFYFDRYGIETVAMRIGSSFPQPVDRRMLTTWLSYDDFVHLVERALLAPNVGYTIVYVNSDNKPQWWDNRHAAHLGWTAQDSSEPYRVEVEAKAPPLPTDDPAAIYQGGGWVKFGPYPTVEKR